jgi:predicted nucleic acid-binding protein
MIFVDSGAWFAYLIQTDQNHPRAVEWMGGNHEPLLTTDYIVDETLTLLRSRGHNEKAVAWGTALVTTDELAKVHRVTETEFTLAWIVFSTFRDKEWSFTDCTSKVVMEALGVTTAFGFDQHFRQFGTVRLVPDESTG